MPLDDIQLATLAAFVNDIIPPEQYPDAYAQKILPRIEAHFASLSPADAEEFAAALKTLNDESFAVFGQSFADLHSSTREELLDRLESDNPRLPWPTDPAEFIQSLVDLIAEAVGIDRA